MRVLRRTRDTAEFDAPATVAEPTRVEEREVVSYRWTPGSVLVVLAAAVLAAVGIVGLVRAEVNDTWYQPVVQVADINHTPLLAGIEAGVGALVVILGLLGARALTALVCAAVAIGGVVVAIDPEQWTRELAAERWWAITLAIGGALAALAVLVPAPTGIERRRIPTVRRGYGGRVVEQH